MHSFDVFSTKRHDIESGLYYYGFRYYSPADGRWLSRDIIQEEGGINLYNMINNDTINDIDFLGLCEEGSVKGSTKVDADPVGGNNKKIPALTKAAKAASKHAGNAERAAAGFAGMGSSVGVPFEVKVTLTWECCECKDGTPEWVKQTDIGPEPVPNPNLGGDETGEDLWGSRPELVAGIGDAIIETTNKVWDEAKKKCGGDEEE